MNLATARGSIATPHHLATEAGAAVIEAGGNAIDAALTAAAALCVVYPNNVALGGDLVALVRSPDGQVRFLNATGPAAKAESLENLRKLHGEKLPLHGIDTVTVPGGVCGWNQLHEAGATRPWARHLDAAIAFARDGVPVARRVAESIHELQAELVSNEGWREVFVPNGSALREGELLTQPALAATLERIAEHGSIEFYEGDTARAWISGLQQLGSKITIDDTTEYLAHWDDPIEGEFADHRVLTGPPNSSGFILLRALRAVAEGINDPLGAGAGDLARAFAEANAVRAVHLADPRLGGLSGDELINLEAPSGALSSAPKPTGDTIGISAATSDGWAVSLINSIYFGFGSGILDPATGVIFQNRGTAFSLDPASPNAFAPGKRPRHTLMPVLVLRGDDLAWVPATMGGSGQPQIHTHLLLRSLAGATPHAATHAPRWIVEEPGADGRIAVRVEEDVPSQAQQSLIDAGFDLEIVPAHSSTLGHANLIRLDQHGYAAASDPRSDGSAAIVQ